MMKNQRGYLPPTVPRSTHTNNCLHSWEFLTLEISLSCEFEAAVAHMLSICIGSHRLHSTILRQHLFGTDSWVILEFFQHSLQKQQDGGQKNKENNHRATTLHPLLDSFILIPCCCHVLPQSDSECPQISKLTVHHSPNAENNPSEAVVTHECGLCPFRPHTILS